MFEKMRALSTVVLKFGIGAILATVSLGALAIAVYWYSEHRQQENRTARIASVTGTVSQFEDHTFSAKVTMRTKYEPDEHLSYDLTFTSDDGLKIDGEGKIFIEFLDKNGFSVHRQDFSELTRSCKEQNGALVCTGLSDRGKFYLSFEQFQQLASISVSHTFKLSSLRPVSRAPASKPEQAVESATSFDAELETWDVRAAFIRRGMTYMQMISAAGQPRTSAYVSYEDIVNGFNGQKYNYGRKWIYFKDNLVAAVK